MLKRVKTLRGYKLDSFDGEIGKIREFYFDDRHWTVRYLVAETGSWLTQRQVLLSPYALAAVIDQDRSIAVTLTKKQITDSPSLDTDKPVSRQFEAAYYGYYGWPMYWSGPYMWGSYPYLVRDSKKRKESGKEEKKWDPHLRSTQEVSTYHIHAVDGDIGHAEDFIIDDETWAIRYLVIDTRNWWPGRQVLISPQWIKRVSWEKSEVFINLDRETIRQSPEYAAEAEINRDYETRLHGHYNRQGYWVSELSAKEKPF